MHHLFDISSNVDDNEAMSTWWLKVDTFSANAVESVEEEQQVDGPLLVGKIGGEKGGLRRSRQGDQLQSTQTAVLPLTDGINRTIVRRWRGLSLFPEERRSLVTIPLIVDTKQLTRRNNNAGETSRDFLLCTPSWLLLIMGRSVM